MARTIMRTLLFRAGRKPGAPVKRAELTAALGGRAAGVPAAVKGYVIKVAAARLASDFGLEMAALDLAPVRSAATARGGGGAGAATPAVALRTLLPPRLAAAVRAVAPPSNAAAPGVGLLAAALVRLDRGGAGTPAADLWAHLTALGAAPGASVPGVGDPAAAVDAAVAARWLASRVERGAEGPVTLYSLGDAAMADDGAGLDEFVGTLFESADPARALAR
jgi:hypothetical protein